MIKLNRIIKYNPLTVYAYNKFLNYKCRNINAYFFVATTGRSGSESLSKILYSINNVVCLHEPYPVMYNDFQDDVDKSKYFNDLFFKIKQINIKRAACGYSYYVETNHQFIKNFISQAIECFGNKIRIIHLRRNPIKVATSFYSIGSIPGKTMPGRYYLIDPSDKDNLIKISDILYEDCEFSHDFYKCLWYWYEVEARIKKHKQLNPKIPWYLLQTEDLNNTDTLIKMFKKFDIAINSKKLLSLVGTRANSKYDKKKQCINFENAKIFHANLLEKMEERYGTNFWT